MVEQKRLKQMTLLFLFVLLLLISRLGYIQLIGNQHFSKHNVNLVEESIKQRTQNFVLHSGRGYFSDRHGQALNIDYYPSVIVFPFLQYQHWPVEILAEIVKVEQKQIIDQIQYKKEPFLLQSNGKPLKLTEKQMQLVNSLKIPGLYAHYVQQRTVNSAPHLIGVIGENEKEVMRRYEEQVVNGSLSIHSEIGVSGMQRAFDPFLISQGVAKLSYFVDNLNRPLFGFDVRYLAPANPYHPTEVITTIDRDIQEKVTNVLKNVGLVNGGVVLLDIHTNDLIAMVSTPTFDVNFPFDAGAKNHLITSYTPGSIFKIVVAAAAIDLNLTNKNDLYNCNLNLYGDGDEPRLLGNLSFQNSFAQSCNYTFAYLARQLLEQDQQILEKYAKKLGLTKQVGWTGDIYRLSDVAHFPEEENGRVTITNQDITDPFAIAQTAIGQRSVRVTPLAVANMMATIARGGEKRYVRGAVKIAYENGTTVVDFPAKKMEDDETISRYTAMRLQELLRLVVKDEQGTAYHYLHDSPYSVAGKTGTAQKGMNKEQLSHWFAGYFPATKPKYSMVIIDLDHHNGNAKTLKAFRQIVDYLSFIDQ